MVLCFGYLVPSWCHCLGKLWDLWEVCFSWRKQILGGLSLKVIPGSQFCASLGHEVKNTLCLIPATKKFCLSIWSHTV